MAVKMPGNANTAANTSKQSSQPQNPTTPMRPFALGIRGVGTQLASLKAVHEITTAETESIGKQFGLQIGTVLIDPKSAGLPIGFVAVTEERRMANGEKVLVAGLMMVEDSRTDANMYRTERIGGENVECPVVATDLISPGLNDAVERYMLGLTPSASKFFIAQTVLVPQSATRGEVNETIITTLATCTIGAVMQLGDKHVNDDRFDSRSIKTYYQAKNGRLAVRYDASNSQYFDLAGLPTRNELSIELGRQSAGGSLFGPIEKSVVTHAYVELLFRGGEQDRFATKVDTHVYEPLLVISDISPDDSIGFTFSTLFLGIYAGVLAIGDGAWRKPFYPRFGGGNQPVARDLLMLPTMIYDPAQRKYLDRMEVAEGELDNYLVDRLLEKMTIESPKLAIDIPRASPASYLLAYLAAGANDDNARDESGENILAQDAILELRTDFLKELNIFTDGHFPADYNGPILQSEDYRLLLGEARIDTGRGVDVVVDPREFDYRAFLTRVGATDRSIVEDFDQTTYPNGNLEDIRKRVVQQDRLKRQIFTNDIHYSTSAARYLFADEFVVMFVEACTAAELVVDRMNDGSNRNSGARRSQRDRSRAYDLTTLRFGDRGYARQSREEVGSAYSDRVNVGYRR